MRERLVIPHVHRHAEWRRVRVSASANGNINDTVALPASSKVTYKATGSISSSASGSISDAATVSAPAGVTDPKPANNTATDTDTL